MSDDESRPLIRKHIKLEDVLLLATPDELVGIVDILLDKANDRILSGDTLRQKIASYRTEGELHKVVYGIALEVRALGSNSIASVLRRGQPVSYDQVVRDVASELRVDFTKNDRPADIEQKLLDLLSAGLADQNQQSAAESEPQAESVLPASEQGTLLSGPMLGVFRSLGAGAISGVLAKGAVGAAVVGGGALSVLPVSALAAYGAYTMATRNKARPELQNLTKIVVQIARIRSGIVAADLARFREKLRACL